jgi:hypothetical protein
VHDNVPFLEQHPPQYLLIALEGDLGVRFGGEEELDVMPNSAAGREWLTGEEVQGGLFVLYDGIELGFSIIIESRI